MPATLRRGGKQEAALKTSWSLRACRPTNAAEMLMHEEENQELSVFLDEVLNSEEETNYYALWIYYWEELLGESAPTRYVA